MFSEHVNEKENGTHFSQLFQKVPFKREIFQNRLICSQVFACANNRPHFVEWKNPVSDLRMKLALCIGTVFLCVLISSVNCQEDEKDGKFWDRIKEMFRSFTEAARKLWDEFKNEVSSRTRDMRDWTSEMMDSFKQRMRDWVNNRPNLSDDERQEMNTYIEKLQVPEEKSR